SAKTLEPPGMFDLFTGQFRCFDVSQKFRNHPGVEDIEHDTIKLSESDKGTGRIVDGQFVFRFVCLTVCGVDCAEHFVESARVGSQ
ncbi:hypothetical protein HDV00_010707, partial [Rhizophlyctis rosea]